MNHILVVDDDKEIARAIQKILEREELSVSLAFNGNEALDAISKNKFQLVLMDVMMPGTDGISATMKIRETQNIPIIIISAKTQDSDKIIGLNIGADDYITKPFNPQELVARVKSQLRRYTYLGGSEAANNNEVMTNGRVSLDIAQKQVFVDGEPARLTATEYKIMEFLMRNMGMVFSAEQIYENVWNEPSYAAENTVMVHIRRIREKIEINPREPEYLKVVWGLGYKIEKHNHK